MHERENGFITFTKLILNLNVFAGLYFFYKIKAWKKNTLYHNIICFNVEIVNLHDVVLWFY